MISASRHEIVATSGNQLLAGPVGAKAYLGNGRYNCNGGQGMMWDKQTNKIIDQAGFDTAKQPVLGVGIGKSGRKANRVLELGGYGFNLWRDKFHVTTTPARCPVSQVIDIDFGCVKCNESHGMVMYVRDAMTKILFGADGETEWFIPFSTRCKPDCASDDCFEGKISGYQVACKVADQINLGKTKIKKNGTIIGALDNTELTYTPMKAVAVPSGRKGTRFCLSVADSTCSTCAQVQGLERLEVTHQVNGADVVETIDLKVFFQEVDQTTTIEMLYQLEEYIDEKFKEIGISAGVKVSGGESSCCPWEISLIGCPTLYKLFVYDGAATVEITGCTDDTWNSHTIENTCKGCDGTDGSWDAEGKVRIWYSTLALPCDCNGLPNDQLGLMDTLGEIRDIQFLEGFDEQRATYTVLRNNSQGVGIGYKWISKSIGGNSAQGRSNFSYYGGEPFGEYGNGRPKHHSFLDAQNNVQCAAQYCSINIKVETSSRTGGENAVNALNTSTIELLIPTSDQAAGDELFGIFKFLADKSAGCTLSGTGCFVNAADAPCCADSDNDGATDLEEAAAGTDPLVDEAPNQMVIDSAVAVDSTSITVQWTEAGVDSNLASVEIYRDSVLINTIAAGLASFVDTGLTASTAYSYTLIGVDASGTKGILSLPVVGTTTA